jgi:hypothetical protein
MSVRDTAQHRQLRLQEDLDRFASEYFEPKLRSLKLGEDQISEQTLPELEQSLQTINDAMSRPEQFCTLRTRVTADGALIVAKATTESQIEIGILPILLRRKTLILERIKLLRPVDQLAHLKSEIAATLPDQNMRDKVLRILDNEEQEWHAVASQLEAESKEVGKTLETELQASGQAVAMAKLEARFDALDKSLTSKDGSVEKSLAKLEEKAVSKWDVVVIVFMTLAALGGLLGAILGIIKWVSGA